MDGNLRSFGDKEVLRAEGAEWAERLSNEI